MIFNGIDNRIHNARGVDVINPIFGKKNQIFCNVQDS